MTREEQLTKIRLDAESGRFIAFPTRCILFLLQYIDEEKKKMPMIDFCPHCGDETLHVLRHDSPYNGNAIECTQCHTIWEGESPDDPKQLSFNYEIGD